MTLGWQTSGDASVKGHFFLFQKLTDCGMMTEGGEKMRYTDLIFDLYGTLVDIHTEESEEVWAKTAQFMTLSGAVFTGPELKQAFLSGTKACEAEAGHSYECFPDIPFEWIMGQILRARGIPEGNGLGMECAKIFRLLSLEYIRLYPGVKEALACLRARGYRLWLLSNAQRAFIDFELPHLGLEELFDGVYISSDHRCRKPDARFFSALIKEQGLDPVRCLMIGNDRETDIAGANGFGIDTIYMHTDLTPAHQTKADPKAAVGSKGGSVGRWEYEGADWTTLAELICAL